MVFRVLGVCRWLICVGWLTATGAVAAETLDNLYEATVPVADQSEKERHRALMEALAQVLVRVTGQEVGDLNLVLQTQRSRAEDYLLEYRYVAAKEMTPPVLGRKSGASNVKAPESSLQLVARFSPETVRTLLAKAGLPLWPRHRPAVLVWWQLEEQGQRRMVSLESEQANSLRQEAQRRGIPVVLPMGDLEDNLAMESLWQFDPDAIAQVAERYGISAVLVGRARGSSTTGWEGQWWFSFQGRQGTAVPAPSSSEGDGQSWLDVGIPAELEVAGLEAVVQAMVQHYGIQLGGIQLPVNGGEDTGQVEIVVSHVANFEAYMEIQRYLQSLESIRSVELQATASRRLHYRLRFDGSLSALKALLVLGAPLVEESSAEPQPADAPQKLSYRFQRL